MTCIGVRFGWTLIRPIEPTDVLAISFYSSRIQEMSFRSRIVSLGPSLCEVSHVSKNVLFSRLRVLDWHPLWDAGWNLDFVLNSIGDNVTEIAGGITYCSKPTFMGVLKERLCHLSHLTLRDSYFEQDDTCADIARFFREVLPNAKNLQELQLMHTFQQYLNIWNLILWLPLLSKITVLEPALPSSLSTYHKLTDVAISLDDFRFLCRILADVRFPNLQNLRLTFLQPCNVGAVRSIISSVVVACDTSPLTCLSIYCEYDDEQDGAPENPDFAEEALGIDDLRPLVHQFSKLEELNLELDCPWVLEDSAIEEIVRIWGPGLRSLCLDPGGGWSTRCITVRGLEHLALHCPRLITLGMPFDGVLPDHVRSIPAQTQADDTSTSHRNDTLRRLYVGCTPLDRFTVNNMALYLSSLFPNLETIAPADRLEDQRDPLEPPMGYVGHAGQGDRTAKTLNGPFQRWEMVEAIVPILGVARKQERSANYYLDQADQVACLTNQSRKALH
ncbi:hypothetical protein EIP91_003752 [Steccherinum ochraceum]|uniref:F-box domain-containing protein n=1 Tax=Steccherinum ochraceum TaxID=92696 RepID=A0A4R0RIG6_9APHY|nr:hypothetical protein EIP91_003752 [Steccherinum ochraceum]